MITALKINDFAPRCRPVYIALDTIQLFSCFVIDFFIRNFQNNFKLKYFPSALLFISFSLADLAVSIVYWQINHIQGSVPQCTRVMSPKLTLQSCKGSYLIALSKLADFAASCSEGKCMTWETVSFVPQKNPRNQGAIQINTGNMTFLARQVVWCVKQGRMSNF